MVHDEELRSKFVKTTVEFLVKNKFDGLGNILSYYNFYFSFYINFLFLLRFGVSLLSN